MNIPKQLLMTPQVQLYSFILMGLVINFIWPLNMLYVFLLTRAYSRDKSNLFKSFSEETMEQSKNTISLIKRLIKHISEKPKNKSEPNEEKESKSDNAEDSNENTENLDNNSDESSLRKRKNTNSEYDEDIDSI
tara:strand:- start:316 stop:717 length:402 start_codon:yes stop_codon:yes gene_type:complete